MSYSLNAFGEAPATAAAPQILASLNTRWSQMAPVKGIGLSLASIGTMLHALQLLHQAAHWQVRGPTYYGDHLLFERVYKGIRKEIDAIGERTVNTGDLRLVCPILVANLSADLLQGWGKGHGKVEQAKDLVAMSLGAEKSFLVAIGQALAQAPASDGTQNLLQGIADAHEAVVYLLQQRLVRGA